MKSFYNSTDLSVDCKFFDTLLQYHSDRSFYCFVVLFIRPLYGILIYI